MFYFTLFVFTLVLNDILCTWYYNRSNVLFKIIKNTLPISGQNLSFSVHISIINSFSKYVHIHANESNQGQKTFRFTQICFNSVDVLEKRNFWLNNTSIWCLMSLLKYLLNKFFIPSHLTQMCNISYSHKNILGKSWCFFFLG